MGIIVALVNGAGAEPPDYAKILNSSKEYKDVKAEADCAGSLQIVVDKYLLLGAYADNTFRPAGSLRRGEMAGWLDRAARRAEQLIDIVTEDYPGDRGKFRQAAYPDAHQAKSLELFQQVKEFPATDPCYAPSLDLAERYHLVVDGPPDAAVSADEYAQALKALFHYKGGPKGKKTVPRGEAVDAYCDAFQFYLDEVEQKMLKK